MKTFIRMMAVGVLFALAVVPYVIAEESPATGENVPSSQSVTEAVSPNAAVVVTPAVPVTVLPPAPVEKSTLENLQTAFEGESNAHARYLAFAQKADEEGYGKAASLFRAAARAEQIHFEWHSKLIKEMGGTPSAKMETPMVKTTAENLQAAYDGEMYESTKMYPEFLAKAEKDKAGEATDAFEDAGKAEAVHASLYREAMQDLKSWKGKGSAFYVCPTCGNVVERTNFMRCPICGAGKRAFLVVK